MKNPTFPTIKYGLPFLATVSPRAVMWGAEQAASQATWWTEFPWVSVTLIGLAWFFGTLYADLWGQKSQLRDWLRWKFRVFTPENLVFQSVKIEGVEYQRLAAKIRFRKKSRNTTVLLHVYGILKDKKAAQRLTLKMIDGEDIYAGEERLIYLATTPNEPGHHSGWGGLPDHLKSVVAGSKNAVRIEAISAWRRQSYSVFIARPNENMNTHGFVIAEDAANIFDIEGY